MDIKTIETELVTPDKKNIQYQKILLSEQQVGEPTSLSVENVQPNSGQYQYLDIKSSDSTEEFGF